MKPPTRKFECAPWHPCPYTNDGLRFGDDHDEYDVCDDCYLSVACHKYKMKCLFPNRKYGGMPSKRKYPCKN